MRRSSRMAWGANDTRKLEEYLSSIREIELRVARAEQTCESRSGQVLRGQQECPPTIRSICG